MPTILAAYLCVSSLAVLGRDSLDPADQWPQWRGSSFNGTSAKANPPVTWNATTNVDDRWRKFSYEELKARDKTSLDVFWLRDKSLTDLDNLPEPDELAEEIIENLEAGLNSFREVLAGLNKVA